MSERLIERKHPEERICKCGHSEIAHDYIYEQIGGKKRSRYRVCWECEECWRFRPVTKGEQV